MIETPVVASDTGPLGRAETTIRAIRRGTREFFARGHHLWVGVALIALVYALARAGVGSVATYFYVLAWYPALLAADGLLLRRSGGSLLLHRPWALLSLFCWSVPFWLLYEAINLRIENWYYIDVPNDPVVSRLFMLASFATVLPAIVYVYLLISPIRWIARLRTPTFRAGRNVRRTFLILGVAFLALSIVLPRYGYPLVWGFLPFLLEPLNRRPRWPSLLRDLEFGSPRRVILLLIAGLLTGLYWEAMNVPAGAKWIYTVPFFDQTFGVEMPPLGFLGFAPFALSAYSFVRFLEIRGISAPFETSAERAPVLARVSPGSRVFLWPTLIALASFGVVPWMERETVDSREGTVQQLKSTSRRDRAILALAGIEDLDEFLARGETRAGRLDIARLLVTAPDRVDTMVEEAALANLRGIGVANARLLLDVGVGDVSALAKRDAAELFAELRLLGERGSRVKAPRVRTWVRGARDAVAKLATTEPSR